MWVILLPRRSRGLTSLRVLDLIQMQHFRDPHSRRIKIGCLLEIFTVKRVAYKQARQ